MRVREHRPTLADSMATVKEIPATKQALQELIAASRPSGMTLIDIKPYSYDDRIDWDTHLIRVKFPDNTTGIFGMSDGPLESSHEKPTPS